MNPMKKFKLIFLLPFFMIQSCSENAINPKQDQFVKKLEAFQTKYAESEGNDVAQDGIANEMNAYIEKFGGIKDWTGNVVEVNSSLGDTWIVVKPSNSDVITLKLWPGDAILGNEDAWKKTDLFKLLPTLKVDDALTFSGKVVSEMSLTDDGMMSEPEIVIEPTNIKIDQK
ncbi:MAG: hypothetical protein RLZZ531_1281 [Bacteroidota bacterium]|jgi:hypothetical protein